MPRVRVLVQEIEISCEEGEKCQQKLQLANFQLEH